MQKSWIELQVEIPSSFLEAVANFLIEQGSPGIVQKAPGQARERVIAYFPKDRSWAAKRKRVRTYLRSLCKLQPSTCRLYSKVIREENWGEAWKSNFRPVRVTSDLVVKPPWEPYPPKGGGLVIEIDPGMAFGTGTHPSTQICLRTLKELIPSFSGHPSILDVGTGSGILAIAGLKLGGGRVVAMDIDPLAIQNAQKNARRNKLDSRIDFRTGSLNHLRGHFDIVVANLLPQELLPLSTLLSRRLARGGVLIISGFLRGQKREIAEVFAAQGLEVQVAREAKGWAGFALSRKKERNEAQAVSH